MTQETMPIRPHRLWEVIDAVNETHPGAGKLTVAELVAVRARLLFMAVSPAGSGKSAASKAVANVTPDSHVFDFLTESSLAKSEFPWSDFGGLIVIDDLGKSGGEYGRIRTIVTLVELIYTGYFHKETMQQRVHIENFHGHAIVNAHPPLMNELMKSPEWESTIMDKSLRYYHFNTPTRPTTEPIVLPKFRPVPLESVTLPDVAEPQYAELRDIGLSQWKRGRVVEHLSSLLRSCATFDERTVVTDEDISLLTYLLRPMRTERYITRKDDFEADRTVDRTLIYLFSLWATYGAFTIEDVMDNYHVTSATVYKILDKYKTCWQPVLGEPRRYAPNRINRNQAGNLTMVDVLRDVGIEWTEPAGSS